MRSNNTTDLVRPRYPESALEHMVSHGNDIQHRFSEIAIRNIETAFTLVVLLLQAESLSL